jgi:type IV pilus assembly protein PilQ
MQTRFERSSVVRKAAALLTAWLLVAPDLAPLALASTPQSLKGIDVQSDQVKLETGGPVKYKAFLAQNPPRLVVDLYNTQYRAEKSVDGKGAILQRVRGGQFSVAPKRVSRVVMELASIAGYEVTNMPTGLLVKLGQASALAAKEATGKGAGASAPVDLYRDAPAATAMMQGGEPPSTIDTNVKVGIPAAPSAPVASTTMRRSSRDLMSSLPREKVNLDFDTTDVRDILKLLGVRAGINIIYGSDVAGSLSLHLRGVPFDEAFRTVLQMTSLTTQQVGDNILRVLTPSVLKTERGSALPTTRVFQLSYTKADEVKPQLDAVRSAEGRPGQSVVAKSANALIVTDTTEGMLEIERLIAQIDKRPTQVLIEAKLIEVQHNKSMDLGIQWDYASAGNFNNNPGNRWFVGTQQTASTPFSIHGDVLQNNGPTSRGTGVNLPASDIVGALTLGRVTDTSFLAATLSAAAKSGKAKVLSDPKVATLNNQQATINITTQIPYVTSSVTSTGVATQTVSYTTVGITLTVTPTVNADGRVTLKINPQVSQPSQTAASAGTTGAVAVDTRNADTTVLVRDGETIVIGGLITDTESVQEAKVPLLGDIPILGWFFRKKSTSRVRQELLVFVTPKILAD